MERVLRSVTMQNSRLIQACFPIKIDKVWIDRFCVRYDWCRRLQSTSSVSPVWLYSGPKFRSTASNIVADQIFSGVLNLYIAYNTAKNNCNVVEKTPKLTLFFHQAPMAIWWVFLLQGDVTRMRTSGLLTTSRHCGDWAISQRLICKDLRIDSPSHAQMNEHRHKT